MGIWVFYYFIIGIWALNYLYILARGFIYFVWVIWGNEFFIQPPRIIFSEMAWDFIFSEMAWDFIFSAMAWDFIFLQSYGYHLFFFDIGY